MSSPQVNEEIGRRHDASTAQVETVSDNQTVSDQTVSDNAPENVSQPMSSTTSEKNEPALDRDTTTNECNGGQRSSPLESQSSGVWRKIWKHPVFAFLSLLAALAGLGSFAIDFGRLMNGGDRIVVVPPLDGMHNNATDPKVNPVKQNASLHGIIEFGLDEIWAAVVDPSDRAVRVPSDDRIQRRTLSLPALDDRQFSTSATQIANELTQWLRNDCGVPKEHVAWFSAPGVEPDPTQSPVSNAGLFFHRVTAEKRIKNMVQWLAPDLPQVAVLYVGSARIEVDGFASATLTTGEDIVCQTFPSIGELAKRIQAGEDADEIFRELVAVPVDKSERRTPTRTGCPLFVVGEPVERLLATDLNFAFLDGELELKSAQVSDLVKSAEKRFAAKRQDGSNDESMNLAVAKLLEWTARALKSGNIHIVRGGGRGWIYQYVDQGKHQSQAPRSTVTSN